MIQMILTWKHIRFHLAQNIPFASVNAVKFSVPFGACLTDFGGGILMYPSWNKKPAQKFYHGAVAVAKTVPCANWMNYWKQWKSRKQINNLPLRCGNKTTQPVIKFCIKSILIKLVNPPIIWFNSF